MSLSVVLPDLQEQAQQHAFTIVALEEKLLSLMKTYKDLQEENKTLTDNLERKEMINTAETRG